jgi:hypothetical protein
MSRNIDFIHSHSALERELRMPKHIVLVDAKYATTFITNGFPVENFSYGGVDYIKVPISGFIKMGGLFKNLMG